MRSSTSQRTLTKAAEVLNQRTPHPGWMRRSVKNHTLLVPEMNHEPYGPAKISIVVTSFHDAHSLADPVDRIHNV